MEKAIEYKEGFTIHALGYIANGNSFIARIIWAVILITGYTLAIIMVNETLVQWATKAITNDYQAISAETMNGHNMKMIPVLTVCAHVDIQHQESDPFQWNKCTLNGSCYNMTPYIPGNNKYVNIPNVN